MIVLVYTNFYHFHYQPIVYILYTWPSSICLCGNVIYSNRIIKFSNYWSSQLDVNDKSPIDTSTFINGSVLILLFNAHTYTYVYYNAYSVYTARWLYMYSLYIVYFNILIFFYVWMTWDRIELVLVHLELLSGDRAFALHLFHLKQVKFILSLTLEPFKISPHNYQLECPRTLFCRQ